MNDLCPQRNFIPTVIPIPRYRYTPLAKSYIIFQDLKKLYSLDEGLDKGTIFPELYIPYDPRKHEGGHKYELF